MRPLRALSALRRQAPQPPAPALAAVEPTPARSDAAPADSPRRDAEMIDALEADVLRAIAAVTGAIAKASVEVGATGADLGAIHAHMRDLAAAGRGAASQTVG